MKTDGWNFQNHEDFARQLERKNSSTVLTKKMMDAAFRLATSRMARRSPELKNKDALKSMYSRVGAQPCDTTGDGQSS